MNEAPRLCIEVSNTLETASLSGIQRVTLELSQALSELASVVHLDGRSGRLLTIRPDQRRRIQGLQKGKNVRNISHRIESRLARSAQPIRSPFGFDANDVLLDIEASWHAPIRRAELLPQLDSPTAALIHDILPITNPDWFPPASVARFRSWFDAHTTAGSTLLAVSNASADAVAATGVDRPTVVRMGHTDTAATSTGNGILMIGTIEPRKGHATILDALDLLGNAAPIVDVVGRPGWNTEDLSTRLETHSKIRWHRGISDADLEVLWTLSGLLLQPSLGEGFGLPVIEAIHRGVAAATSDIEVMREVGRGQTSLLPFNPQAWADVLARFATDPAAWPRPNRRAGPTWRDTATDVLSALNAAGVWPDPARASQ